MRQRLDATRFQLLDIYGVNGLCTKSRLSVEKLFLSAFYKPGSRLFVQSYAAALLVCARELYGASPQALMVSVGGQSFAHTAELSAIMMAALPAVVETVLAQLRQFKPEAESR